MYLASGRADSHGVKILQMHEVRTLHKHKPIVTVVNCYTSHPLNDLITVSRILNALEII